jgi:EAL domain-containing protein (putative c-di-GMP-specific phosphodiesterase class I)
MLGIELTESTAMADATKAMDIFLRLCVNDISLSIDDFGTGFSSLQQLYQLPFDELKIDRMFVRGLPDDEEARAIVRATVDMAHALNMKVCAEGVETRQALDYLESVNCDRAQGYLISPAVAAEKFETFLGTWNGGIK